MGDGPADLARSTAEGVGGLVYTFSGGLRQKWQGAPKLTEKCKYEMGMKKAYNKGVRKRRTEKVYGKGVWNRRMKNGLCV